MHSPSLRFFIRFVIFALFLTLLLGLDAYLGYRVTLPLQHIYFVYLQEIASLLHIPFQLFDRPLALVLDNGFTLFITYNCTAIWYYLLSTAFLFALPTSMYRRFLFLAISFALITSFNLMRIAIMVWIAYQAPSLFHLFHTLLFQGLFFSLFIALHYYFLIRSLKVV